MRRDKEARTVERNSSVSRSERKKTITIDSDDGSNTSECDIDEQKDESEGQKSKRCMEKEKTCASTAFWNIHILNLLGKAIQSQRNDEGYHLCKMLRVRNV